MPRIQINLTSVLVHNNRKHNSFTYKETIKDLVAKCEPGSHRPPVFKETSLNHKFYRFKKKDYSAHCCESFALPDAPIYPEALVMFKSREKSNLDVLSPNPQDLCCVNLNNIDEPWLIESHEVITPYWDPSSLFSFKPEDIRCKAQLEEIDTVSDYLEVVDNSATIKPPSGQTTISIQNSELSGIDISELKDHVLKAIEEVIKTSSKVDMKIHIVANDANSIEVRVNEGKITTPLESRVARADTKKKTDSLKPVNQTVAGLAQGNGNNLKSQIVANSNVANCINERGIETKLTTRAIHSRKRSSYIKKSVSNISTNHQEHIQESDTPDTTLDISTISSSEDNVNVGNAQKNKADLQSKDKINGNISKKRKRTTDLLELSISPIPNVTPKIRHTHQKSKHVPCHNETTNESKLPKTLREKAQKSKSEPSSICLEQDISTNIDDTRSPNQRKTRRRRDFSYLKYQSKRVLRSSMKNASPGDESQSTAKDCLNTSEPNLQNRTVCDELPRLVRGDLEEPLDYDEKYLEITNITNSQAPVLSVEVKQDDCPILPLIVDFPHETSLSDEKESITPIRKSKRVFKPVDKLDMLELERKFTPIKKEVVQVVPDCLKDLDDAPLLTRLQYAGYGDIADKVSEVGSKSSGSDMTSSSLYSFEYQVELHKQNNLFHRLKNVRVCDHCFRQGDLQKCKGKCGGSFHTNCLSNVGSQPRRVTLPPRTKFAGSKQKSKVKPEMEKPETEPRMLRRCRTRSQCEIITVRSKYIVDPPRKESLPGNFNNLSIADQIDYGMQEMMRQSEHCSSYIDLSDASSDVEYVSQTRGDLDVSEISENLSGINVAHVTADSIILTEEEDQPSALKCTHCRLTQEPPCFSCGLEINKPGEATRRKCSLFRCGRYYHTHCLKAWPQTRWSIGKWSKIQLLEDDFTCPAHRCHTCFSEELGSSASCRLPGDKLARCLLCPSAFHATTFCTPAGSEILSGSQIICPKHRSRKVQAINTGWCFICSEGGNLVCCDTCPTSVHPECQPVNFTDDDKYVCEDCESGRFPLYDEVVWVKLGQYRWWPALILFPNEVPLNVRLLKHQRGDFVVRFFGTNDHYWVNKARSFLFQEGDNDGGPSKPCKSRNKVYQSYAKAIQDAEIAYRLKKEFKLRQEADSVDTLKPPTYIKINKNKPVGNVKCGEMDLSNATACECNPQKPRPCGVDSNCINRLLMTECDPNICRAGIRCRNQAFQRREYSSLAPYKTQGRGWGLKALSSIKQGRFIIEYVGELIDSEEYQRRIRKMHEKKEDNYYFMTVDSDRVIDAGPKGNLSRFMNHSCDPNCVTQKWTVLGETRVGLFANCDIDAGSELTFNYNFEVVGQEKKVCKCGAKTCSGFIGGKVKLDKLRDSSDPALVPKKRRSVQKQSKNTAPIDVWVPPCFVCGGADSNISCNSNLCQKSYHLRCLELDHMPKGGKYTCPRHNCKMCFHRTNRCCVLCLNSYCAYHANGHVRYDHQMGFVCFLHDPLNEVKTHPNTRSAHRKAQEVPESPKSDEDVSEDDLSLMERLERSRRK